MRHESAVQMEAADINPARQYDLTLVWECASCPREGTMREFRIPVALCIGMLVTTPISAKTLVFCSEGSPENFYPAINTTGTSFDANSQIYSRIVEFERGGTRVVPGLAERWDISPDGKTYTFHLRRGVKWHANRILN